jgi:glycogen synthase
MKILFVSNIYPPHVRGGYELGCQSIAHEMKRLGHDVCVATSSSPGYLTNAPGDSSVRVETCFEPVFAYEARLIASLNHTTEWRHYQQRAFSGIITGNALALARLIRDVDPDVIWIFNPLGLGPIGIFEAALTWPARCVVHLMDDIDGMIREYSNPVLSHARFSRLKKRFTAISCSFKAMGVNELHTSYRHHRVIYNGVDFAALAASSAASDRAISGSPKFVYFGQVEEAKGLLQLVEGARLAYSQGLRFEIDIFGKGSQECSDRLHRAIIDAGLQQIVRPQGFLPRSELLRRLPSYDAAILLLSNQEPFGYCVIEAVGCGLAVIVTTDPGSVECLPGDYPLLVNNRDCASEIAGRMAWVCQNRPSAKALAAKTLVQVKSMCDFTTVTIPSYLRTVAACPPNSDCSHLESSLAAWHTAELYAFTH